MVWEEESYQKQWQIQKLMHVHDTCHVTLITWSLILLTPSWSRDARSSGESSLAEFQELVCSLSRILVRFVLICRPIMGKHCASCRQAYPSFDDHLTCAHCRFAQGHADWMRQIPARHEKAGHQGPGGN